MSFFVFWVCVGLGMGITYKMGEKHICSQLDHAITCRFSSNCVTPSHSSATRSSMISASGWRKLKKVPPLSLARRCRTAAGRGQSGVTASDLYQYRGAGYFGEISSRAWCSRGYPIPHYISRWRRQIKSIERIKNVRNVLKNFRKNISPAIFI